MTKPNFLRRAWNKYSKLGKGRKKKQKWRRPTGRDNKMREKRKGYSAVVSVGYKNDKIKSGLVGGKKSVVVYNVKELERVKGKTIIVGSVGKKKKKEIAKFAKDKGIKIHNLNVEELLKDESKK